jgi:hypothetical protein
MTAIPTFTRNQYHVSWNHNFALAAIDASTMPASRPDKSYRLNPSKKPTNSDEFEFPEFPTALHCAGLAVAFCTA